MWLRCLIECLNERKDNLQKEVALGERNIKSLHMLRGRDDSRYGDINREQKRKDDSRLEGEGGWVKIDEKRKITKEKVDVCLLTKRVK